MLGVQATLALEDLLAKQSATPRKLEDEGPALKLLRHRLATEFPALSAERLLLAWNKLDQLRLQICQIFETYDFIICPVTPILAPTLNSPTFLCNGKNISGEHVMQFSCPSNVLGLPTIAFPTNKSAQGLPIGLQIIGPRLSEAYLFQILRELNKRQRLPL